MDNRERPRRTRSEKLLAEAKRLLTQLNDLFTAMAIECENHMAYSKGIEEVIADAKKQVAKKLQS